MAQETEIHRHSDSIARELKVNAKHIADKSKSEHVTDRVMDYGRDVGERVEEVAGNLKGAVDRSVKDQPIVTLGMAAVMGFALGALWKS